MINLYIIIANVIFKKLLIIEFPNSFIASNKRVFFGLIL